MAMRETVRSLRAYFILSGLASLWLGYLNLAASLRFTPRVLATVSGIVNLGISLAFLYMGVFLPGLLRGSAQRVVTLLYVSTGGVVLDFLLSLPNGIQPQALVTVVISLLILWYLLRNVRRLAAEAQNPA